MAIAYGAYLTLAFLALILLPDNKSKADEKIEKPAPAFQPVEIENEKAAKNKKIELDYNEILKNNNCDKKYWFRYEFGNYFQTIADRNKVTPYDLIVGDAYSKRNISQSLQKEIMENYFRYRMPDAIMEKFAEKLGSEELEEQNRKTVWNNSVERDNFCYKKLK